MKALFLLIAFAPAIASVLLFLGGVRLPELTPLAKILLSLVYFAFIIVLKRLLLNDEDSGSGLLGLFSRKERGAGSFRSFTESKEQEMRRKAKAFAMPAEELAFARCVAAAAGYIAGPGEMSPDLEYALMRQLSMLSKGDEDLEAELMEASRTEGSLWREMCFFQNDHERVSAFLSILREIVRGDQMASEEEKGRFCSAAQQLGCPEEEAHRLLRES